MMSWESSEPDFRFARKEVHRLLRRSQHRAGLILLCAALATTGFVAKHVLFPPARKALMSLRIVESDFDLTTAVKPQRDYVDYIWGVFLSGPHLQKVIEEYELYPRFYAKSPQFAVEEMREDLDVQVWRNYFLEDHYDNDDEARSVRFSISWKDRDPVLALAVVRRLGEVVIASETEERRHVFQVGQVELAESARQAAERLAAVQHASIVRRARLPHASGDELARLYVELDDLVVEEKEEQRRLTELSDNATRFELAAKWEQQRSGMRFEMIDPGFVEPQSIGPLTLGASAALVFATVWFLGALLFGAFEVRIRQAEDVRRLGVPLLGAVPPFKGDGPGSLAERLAAADRLR